MRAKEIGGVPFSCWTLPDSPLLLVRYLIGNVIDYFTFCHQELKNFDNVVKG